MGATAHWKWTNQMCVACNVSSGSRPDLQLWLPSFVTPGGPRLRLPFLSGGKQRGCSSVPAPGWEKLGDQASFLRGRVPPPLEGEQIALEPRIDVRRPDVLQRFGEYSLFL